jgi:uncharacterized protein (TIGR02118 family)
MVKVLAFFRRRPDMALEDFRGYWLTRHPDVVTRLPGLRRYVQSHTLLGGYRKGTPAFDGFAEVWFDDTEALRALAGTAASQAVVEDEARFIDRATMGTIITEEHVIKDGPVPADAVKSVELVTRRPGIPVEEFQRYWRQVHGPLGASIPVVRRYVQSHTRRSGYERGRTPAYDGAAITWFDDVQAMRVSATTPEYARTRADEANFLDTSRMPVVLTKEHVIVP